MNMPKSRDIQVKIPPGRIALRRRGIMSLKRPVAGGESCKQDSFLWILTRNCEGTEQLQKENNTMVPIAHIENNFPTKFGIPRQSGRVGALKARIVFEPEYRNVDACRGLEEFSHIWLIWEFSEAKRTKWSPTVRPPRLGGNVRKGVFATRSPFRPNSIGLSCVKLEKVALDEPDSPVLYVEGADLMDGTPIFDIKPYIPYADCHPEATGSFTEYSKDHHLNVEFPQELLERIPRESREVLIAVLADDPRPAYQNDPERSYGMPFGEKDIHFRVDGDILRVYNVTEFVKKQQESPADCGK